MQRSRIRVRSVRRGSVGFGCGELSCPDARQAQFVAQTVVNVAGDPAALALLGQHHLRRQAPQPVEVLVRPALIAAPPGHVQDHDDRQPSSLEGEPARRSEDGACGPVLADYLPFVAGERAASKCAPELRERLPAGVGVGDQRARKPGPRFRLRIAGDALHARVVQRHVARRVDDGDPLLRQFEYQLAEAGRTSDRRGEPLASRGARVRPAHAGHRCGVEAGTSRSLRLDVTPENMTGRTLYFKSPSTSISVTLRLLFIRVIIQ